MNKDITEKNTTEEQLPESRDIVGVRFKDTGKTYYFSPGDLTLSAGDGVIVETVRGVEFATVTTANMSVEYSKFSTPLRDVLRRATPEDIERTAQNREKEVRALEICAAKIQEHGLDMKLMSCEYSFDGSRITFCFLSDSRVDFRALVRDLATIFRTRIELRQIGVRDKAKLMGGLGTCGRAICCASFLNSFMPVSIKMAKDQNIALSPSKISGICGRLMCCLKYEQDVYEETRQRMPSQNQEVMTPDGPGTVIESNVITEHIKVRVLLNDGSFDVRGYGLNDVAFSGGACGGCQTKDGCPACDKPAKPEKGGRSGKGKDKDAETRK